MRYYLKTGRGAAADEIESDEGNAILHRGRHAGRRVVETYVLHPDGHIDRYLERARRKLGSNAIVSRTWLCETYHPEQDEEWGDDRYITNPEEAVAEADPSPEAVLVVLLGAEGDSEANVEQLNAVRAHH